MSSMSFGRLQAAAARIGVTSAMTLALAIAGTPASAATSASASSAAASASAASALDAASWTGIALGGVDPKVFALALEAASTAVSRGLAAAPATLTVIDYSKPSTQPRMWVYDLRSRALLFQELVSHGRGSG